MLKDRAIFLDRDGTINRDVPYCSRPEDFELLPNVGEGIRLLSRLHLKLVVVTNQSGIARGYFSEQSLADIHRKMRAELARWGATIHGIYYCPHHPDDKCACRKPETGLFLQAARELHLQLVRSYVMGDKMLDVMAAQKLGCKAVLIPSSEPEISLPSSAMPDADFVGTDFYAGAAWVVDQETRF